MQFASVSKSLTRSDRAHPERDEEDGNSEHSGGVWPSLSLNSSGRTARKSWISLVEAF